MIRRSCSQIGIVGNLSAEEEAAHKAAEAGKHEAARKAAKAEEELREHI